MKRNKRKSVRKNWKTNQSENVENNVKINGKENGENIKNNKGDIDNFGSTVPENVQNAENTKTVDTIINVAENRSTRSPYHNEDGKFRKGNPGRRKQIEVSEGADIDDNDDDPRELIKDLRRRVRKLSKTAGKDNLSAMMQLLNGLEKIYGGAAADTTGPITIIHQTPRPIDRPANTLPDRAGLALQGEPAKGISNPSDTGNHLTTNDTDTGDRRDTDDKLSSSPAKSVGNIDEVIECKTCGQSVPGGICTCGNCGANLVKTGERILEPVHRNPHPMFDGDENFRSGGMVGGVVAAQGFSGGGWEPLSGGSVIGGMVSGGNDYKSEFSPD